jgi:glycosyltransferase involved in cell wall biosynthesis
VTAARPRLLVIGPTPPPHHGISTFMARLLVAPELHAAFDVVHLDSADRRNLENLGRFDLRNVWLALRHAGELCALIARHRPDIVYFEVSQNAWAYVRDSLFILLPKLTGRRVAVRLNGSDFRNFYEAANGGMQALIRITTARLDGVAVLGEALRDIYAGLLPEERVRVVANGTADLSAEGSAGTAADARAADGAVMSVAYLGALYRPKGILDFLRAAARVRETGSRARFIAAGGWFCEETRREALELVRHHGLESVVTFPGIVDGERKRALLQDADVLVFPGVQNEGQPYVILEAMAAALPVISTAKGAIEDMVVHGETGFIVPDRSPGVLAEAILRLEADGALRRQLGRAGRRRFVDRFTDERSLAALIGWLRAAAGRPLSDAANMASEEVAA